MINTSSEQEVRHSNEDMHNNTMNDSLDPPSPALNYEKKDDPFIVDNFEGTRLKFL